MDLYHNLATFEDILLIYKLIKFTKFSFRSKNDLPNAETQLLTRVGIEK